MAPSAESHSDTASALTRLRSTKTGRARAAAPGRMPQASIMPSSTAKAQTKSMQAASSGANGATSRGK
jgi:hypothetical protein